MKGVLRYPWMRKASGLVLTLVPVVATALALTALGDVQLEDRLWFALPIPLFGGMGGLLVVEYFRVRHTFDDEGLEYQTPWTQHRTLRWAEVVEVKWSSRRSLFIRDVHGQKFRIAPSLAGLRDFARVAQERIPKPVLEASPAAVATLALMRLGASFALMDDDDTPEKMLARRRRGG